MKSPDHVVSISGSLTLSTQLSGSERPGITMLTVWVYEGTPIQTPKSYGPD